MSLIHVPNGVGRLHLECLQRDGLALYVGLQYEPTKDNKVLSMKGGLYLERRLGKLVV